MQDRILREVAEERGFIFNIYGYNQDNTPQYNIIHDGPNKLNVKFSRNAYPYIVAFLRKATPKNGLDIDENHLYGDSHVFVDVGIAHLEHNIDNERLLLGIRDAWSVSCGYFTESRIDPRILFKHMWFSFAPCGKDAAQIDFFARLLKTLYENSHELVRSDDNNKTQLPGT